MANEPNYSSNPSKDEPKKEKVRVIPLEYMPPTQITVMNTPNQTFAMPVADARSHLGKITVTLPFSAALAEQSLEGSMSEVLKDRHFMQAVGMIAEKLR